MESLLQTQQLFSFGQYQTAYKMISLSVHNTEWFFSSFTVYLKAIKNLFKNSLNGVLKTSSFAKGQCNRATAVFDPRAAPLVGIFWVPFFKNELKLTIL